MAYTQSEFAHSGLRGEDLPSFATATSGPRRRFQNLSAGQHLSYQANSSPLVLLDHKRVGDPRPPPFTQTDAFVWRRSNAQNCFRQQAGIAKWDGQQGSQCSVELLHRWDGEGDRGKTHGHGLEQTVRHALSVAGKDKDLRCAQILPYPARRTRRDELQMTPRVS